MVPDYEMSLDISATKHEPREIAIWNATVSSDQTGTARPTSGSHTPDRPNGHAAADGTQQRDGATHPRPRRPYRPITAQRRRPCTPPMPVSSESFRIC